MLIKQFPDSIKYKNTKAGLFSDEKGPALFMKRGKLTNVNDYFL